VDYGSGTGIVDMKPVGDMALLGFLAEVAVQVSRIHDSLVQQRVPFPAIDVQLANYLRCTSLVTRCISSHGALLFEDIHREPCCGPMSGMFFPVIEGLLRTDAVSERLPRIAPDGWHKVGCSCSDGRPCSIPGREEILRSLVSSAARYISAATDVTEINLAIPYIRTQQELHTK